MWKNYVAYFDTDLCHYVFNFAMEPPFSSNNLHQLWLIAIPGGFEESHFTNTNPAPLVNSFVRNTSGYFLIICNITILYNLVSTKYMFYLCMFAKEFIQVSFRVCYNMGTPIDKKVITLRLIFNRVAKIWAKSTPCDSEFVISTNIQIMFVNQGSTNFNECFCLLCRCR